MDGNGVQNGWLGSLCTIFSVLGMALSFVAHNISIITVPFTIVAAVYAIKYYRTAIKYYNSKKPD